MHQKLTCARITRAMALAGCVLGLTGCDPSPTSPDVQISFVAPGNLASCAGLTGVFFTPTIVVLRDTETGGGVTFTGNPALVVDFDNGRFTSNTLATGLPAITNVGSFSVTGGYVIFGERPFMPRLSSSSQRSNCDVGGSRLVLGNDDALFDFGSGMFERARVHVELVRR